jgi:hypothetical protein
MRNNIQLIQVHNDFSIIPSNCSSNPIPQNPDLQARLSNKFLYISSKFKVQFIFEGLILLQRRIFSLFHDQHSTVADCTFTKFKGGEEAINQKA